LVGLLEEILQVRLSFLILRLTLKSGDRLLKLLATQTEHTRAGQVSRALTRLSEYLDTLATALSAKSR
jgi:hypothetical protein